MSSEKLDSTSERIEIAKEYDILSNVEPAMRQRIEQKHNACVKVYERDGIEVPALSEYAAIRPDIYTHLTNVHNQMEIQGKEPDIIFYPINLPLARSQSIAKNMTADTTILNNPLKVSVGDEWTHRFSGESDGFENYLGEISFIEEEKEEQYLQSLGATLIEKGNGSNSLLWNVAVISATDKPQDLGKSYSDINGQTCTISQYIALQFSRIQTGLSPVDKKEGVQGTRTWLYKGEDFYSIPEIPYGFFRFDDGKIVVASTPSAAGISNLGRRSVEVL